MSPPTAFVSYARGDLDVRMLRDIARQMSIFGTPYVDDLQDHRGTDRMVTVLAALWAADTFVAVVTPHYGLTDWTRDEFVVARHRGIPVIARLPGGRLLRVC